MELDKKVNKQTIETLEYYKNLDNIEQVPIDILRMMYKDILEHSIPTKKVKDKIKELDVLENAEALEDIMNRKNYTITELIQLILQELLEDK